MTNTVYLPVYMKFLLEVKRQPGKNLQQISHNINGTYSYLYKVIKDMEKNNMIKVTKIGRSKIPMLTENGEKVVELIEQVDEVIEKNKSSVQGIGVVHED